MSCNIIAQYVLHTNLRTCQGHVRIYVSQKIKPNRKKDARAREAKAKIEMLREMAAKVV